MYDEDDDEKMMMKMMKTIVMEFDDMMRLAKNTGCRVNVVHDGHGRKMITITI
jgi:hypothetical protein